MLAAQSFWSAAPGRSGSGFVHHEADKEPDRLLFLTDFDDRTTNGSSLRVRSAHIYPLSRPGTVRDGNQLEELPMPPSPSAPNELPPCWKARSTTVACRLFELTSHRCAVAFVISLCALALQHGQQLALRFRDTAVLVELPIPANGVEGVVIFALAVESLECAAEMAYQGHQQEAETTDINEAGFDLSTGAVRGEAR
jgi:hypothetical protein